MASLLRRIQLTLVHYVSTTIGTVVLLFVVIVHSPFFTAFTFFYQEDNIKREKLLLFSFCSLFIMLRVQEI